MILEEYFAALSKRTCATCHWLHGVECMRHAPTVAVVRDVVVTIRPTVLATDRCGEWSEKDKEC